MQAACLIILTKSKVNGLQLKLENKVRVILHSGLFRRLMSLSARCL